MPSIRRLVRGVQAIASVVLIAVLFVADLGEISTGYGNRRYKGNTLLCTF